MQIALCNEVLCDMPFKAQCAYAAALGYDGLEVAPFTLADEPHRMAARERRRIARTASDAGIAITGLHWLLVTPKGLSITSADKPIRTRTQEVMIALVELCADLGGRVLVHGSPAQRTLPKGETVEDVMPRVVDLMGPIAEAAQAAGVVYCLEPLARAETGFINTVEEAVRLVDHIANPHFLTMIDTSAAGVSEAEPVADLIRRWMLTGKIAHIQLNDTNRRGPGEGADRFASVIRALRETGYDRVLAVEPFIYEPDGRATAARAIGYLRGLREAVE